jgi:hypothetical protein
MRPMLSGGIDWIQDGFKMDSRLGEHARVDAVFAV